MKEKITVLFGSPRKNGFTKQAVDLLLAQIDQNHYDVSILDGFHLQVFPCIDCRACLKGLCPFNQRDKMGGILDELASSDIVLLASPIYFAGYPAPLKAIIDRSQQFFLNRAGNRTKVFPKRAKGYLLLTSGASSKEVNDAAELAGKMFFCCINADFQESLIIENTDQMDKLSVSLDRLTTHFVHPLPSHQ